MYFFHVPHLLSMLPLNHVGIMELICWELVGFQKCPLRRSFVKCCAQKHSENSAEPVWDLKRLKIFCIDLRKSRWTCVASCNTTDNFQTDNGKSNLDSAQKKLYLLLLPILQFVNASVGKLTSNTFRLSSFMRHWSGKSSQRFKWICRLKPKISDLLFLN